MHLENEIESVLLFKNEPVSVKDLSDWLGKDAEVIKTALENLRGFYQKRGIVIISNGDTWALGTHPEMSPLIEALQKDEFSRELGRAGLETLAIVAYRGPISRREIDHIRGVNSGFILRTLLIRGLIERADVAGERSYSYVPTLKLLEYLGVTRREDLPEYHDAFKKMDEFVKTNPTEEE
ncbi:SMC-Scp complex subunit ScpB [Candidatus Parcubacteria bacterium]|nr:SMC-Scp complex subunit ScpB [Candidatus Parcubacteria bacterium]